MRRSTLTLTVLSLSLTALGCKKSAPAAPQSAPTVVQAAPAAPDRAAARAANVLGMKAYKAKDYAAAGEKFKSAIAADPGFPLPHYNLACVAALTGDKDAARAQLEWLATSTEPQARRTLIKASRDPDMKALADDPQAQKILQWAGVFPGYRALALDGDAADGDARRLAKAAGGHGDECDGDSSAFVVTRLLKGELAPERPGLETLLVSLADGPAIFDAGGKLVATGDKLDGECMGSQAGLHHVSLGQVVPDDEPELVVHYASGGRASFSEQIDIVKRRADKLVTILSAVIETYDRTAGDSPGRGEDEEFNDRSESGSLTLEPDATIRYREPGKKQPKILRWDPVAFKYQ